MPGEEPISRPGRLFELSWILTLGAATLWSAYRALGTSPTVWGDTLIENSFVDHCLHDNTCTLAGVGATLGVVHSAGYLHWRTLLTWLGLTPDGVYVLLVAMGACAVLLTALVARRVEGRAAAGLAALLMVAVNGVPTQLNVISDVAPVPFLGATFLLAALAFRQRPSVGMAVLLGALAGVLANVYATCLLCGLSAVWVALLVQRRRWGLAVVVGVVFIVTTFVLAPETWITDAQLLLSHAVAGNVGSADQPFVLSIPLVRFTGLAVALWGGVAIADRPLRRKLDVPAAILVPLLLPLVAGSLKGALNPQDKYCSHVLAAAAATIGVVLARGIRAAWRGGCSLVKQPGFGARWWERADRLAPFGAAAALSLGVVSWHVQTGDFTWHDLATAERVLGTGRGWSWLRAARNLKASDDVVRQAALRWSTAWPEHGPEDDLQRAYLLKLRPPEVPQPVPPNLTPLASASSGTTFLELACSWIDWRSFRACVAEGSGPETCTQSGMPDAPGMPHADAFGAPRRTLTLHLPLKPREECPEEWIYMPRRRFVCPGRVLSATGVVADISEDGRWARLKRGPAAASETPAEVAIRWEIGLDGCSVEYRGHPPFFAEGDPASVRLLSTLLPRQDP
jgi:hypothetical protein